MIEQFKQDIDYSLIVLFVLDTIGELSDSEIIKIVSENDQFAYMGCMLAIASLYNSGSIKKDDIFYSITPQGKKSLEYFEAQLPTSFKNRIMANAGDYREEALEDRRLSIWFENLNDDIIKSHMLLSDKGINYLKIEIVAKQSRSTFNVVSSFKKTAMDIYNMFVDIDKIQANEIKDYSCPTTFFEPSSPFSLIHLLALNDTETWNIDLRVVDMNKADEISRTWNQKGNAVIKNIKKYLDLNK